MSRDGHRIKEASEKFAKKPKKFPKRGVAQNHECPGQTNRKKTFKSDASGRKEGAPRKKTTPGRGGPWAAREETGGSEPNGGAEGGRRASRKRGSVERELVEPICCQGWGEKGEKYTRIAAGVKKRKKKKNLVRLGQVLGSAECPEREKREQSGESWDKGGNLGGSTWAL